MSDAMRDKPRAVTADEDYILRRAALRSSKIIDKGRLMNTTHTTPEMRDAFEKLFPVPPNCIWTGNDYASTGYNAWSAHDHCKRWEGFKAAQSQPAPPVPSSVQEIMELVTKYSNDSASFCHTDVTEEEINATFKPLEAALTALVDDNHRLKFELDGVRAMRGPLTDEQCKDLLAAAFFIAAKDDVTVLMTDEDAERTIKLLCELSGFEPPDELGIEPEQGGNHG